MRSEWAFLRADSDGLAGALHAAPLSHMTLVDWVSEKLEEQNLTKSDVVKASCLNQTFAYQIMAGTRKASRDKLIQLAFGLELDIDSACELLERGGANALSPSSRRDVIIAYCLYTDESVTTCDDFLWELGEATLITGEVDKEI